MSHENSGEAKLAQLVQRVYAPVFFEKLAQYGIVADSHEEELALLEMAATIDNQLAQERTKQAAAGGPWQQALADLRTSIYGAATVSDDQHKQAAASLAQDPELAEAALLYASARAGLQS